jgi:hypothetical protein
MVLDCDFPTDQSCVLDDSWKLMAGHTKRIYHKRIQGTLDVRLVLSCARLPQHFASAAQLSGGEREIKIQLCGVRPIDE